jgi:hypothetical protein
MWGGGGGGGGGFGTSGYGGGGGAHNEVSFLVTGGVTEISYFAGDKGTGATSTGIGNAGGNSSLISPPATSGPSTIIAVVPGGFPGSDVASGLPGALGTVLQNVIISAESTSWSSPTAGGLPTGGTAANIAGGGGTGGAPGNNFGGGGNGDIGFGWDGGEGSLCLYWVYPTEVVLSNSVALNNSLQGVGGTATATYRLDSDGQAYATDASGTLIAISGNWLTSGTPADYEVHVRWYPLGGGTEGGDAPNTWLNLGTQRNFTLSATNLLAQRKLQVQIRNATTQNVLIFCIVDFSVDSNP